MKHKILKLRRVELELSQKAVAEALGIAGHRLCQYERYGRPLPEGVETKLRRLLGLDQATDAEGSNDH
jgi:transcriptional regulator with XRE-family HTH domain